jgi:hypothetical protein
MGVKYHAHTSVESITPIIISRSPSPNISSLRARFFIVMQIVKLRLPLWSGPKGDIFMCMSVASAHTFPSSNCRRSGCCHRQLRLSENPHTQHTPKYFFSVCVYANCRGPGWYVMRAAIIKSSMMFPNCSLIAFLGKMLTAAAAGVRSQMKVLTKSRRAARGVCISFSRRAIVSRPRKRQEGSALFLNMGLINAKRALPAMLYVVWRR